jgi:hypothetical protein
VLRQGRQGHAQDSQGRGVVDAVKNITLFAHAYVGNVP